jgi:hypothetical protein
MYVHIMNTTYRKTPSVSKRQRFTNLATVSEKTASAFICKKWFRDSVCIEGKGHSTTRRGRRMVRPEIGKSCGEPMRCSERGKAGVRKP